MIDVTIWSPALALAAAITAPASPADPAGTVPVPPDAEPCPDTAPLAEAERASAVDRSVDEAVEAFVDGKLEDALAALERADCLDARPEHQYIRGAILKEQGECATAITHFDAFLAAEVPEADAEAARALRDECAASVASDPAVGPTVGPPPPDPVEIGIKPIVQPLVDPLERPKPPCPDAPKPDALGIGLTAAGGVLAAAGAGLVIGAFVLRSAAPRSPTLADHDTALRRARVVLPIGWAAGGLGVGTIAAGLFRLRGVRTKREAARDRLPAHCR
ncbi:MAG: hypothetical protein AAF721_15105 [Myxococcota bacterium]